VGGASGSVNNLLFTPAVGALDQAGCGGTGGSAITVSGAGTLRISGDLVSSGAVSVSSGAVRVAGDVYARCQSPVPGAVTNACYPSSASTPCTYPDVAGATRSGYRFVDPNFPGPAIVGGGQGVPNATVALASGVYSAAPGFNGGHCWFLGAGVYDWQGGYNNSADFVSNELKPPDEPDPADNTELATKQFWNTNGVQCAGKVQMNIVSGPRGIPTGFWSFVVTSTRTDTYSGQSYPRESAPSVCYSGLHINNSGQNIQVIVSNVPGATSYNIYAAPSGSCSGPFGLAETLPVSVPVLNTNTNPCPLFTGNGCSLGHESVTLDGNDLGPPFTPTAGASPGTVGAYPPAGETAPLAAGLPNQNPPSGAGSAGDRANENNCETAGVYVTCPGAVKAGAVVFYVPSGGCMNNTNSGDTFIFSGRQYNWVSVYQPGAGSPPANSCALTLGANGNSAYVGLVYAPAASLSVPSGFAFEAAGMGGVIARLITFSGTLPTINYSRAYAPVAPASRLTG
jgi:autotransporter-associated beta strand protein